MPDSPQDDLLSSVLSAAPLGAGIHGHSPFCRAWQSGTSRHRCAAFHFVGSGDGWPCSRASAAPEPHFGGGLPVFAHEGWHLPAGALKLDGEDQRALTQAAACFATLVCGYFEFRADDRNPVRDAPPEVIAVPRGAGGPHSEAIGQTMIAEADCGGTGTRAVLDKLSDTPFLMVVRLVEQSPQDHRGLLATWAEPGTRTALRAMHRDAAQGWTLESPARAAGMSRAGFAQTFHERVGTAPIKYRCDWRLQTIADLAGTAATPHRAQAGDAATARFPNGALNPFSGGPEPRQQGCPVS